MKVFASAILLAAYVSAKELPDQVNVPDISGEIDDGAPMTEEETMAAYWESVR